MSVYMTEDEQIESIKKWWNKHGNLVTVLLSVVLLLVGGYRYWSWHQDKITQQASVAFENLMVSYANHNNKAVRSYANDLINNYGNSVYADAAHLMLARLYISKEKLNEAEKELSLVSKNSAMLPLKQIAKIRMARILANGKSYDKALAELASVVDEAYLPEIYELKGDIYSANGQFQDAFKSYQLALEQDKLNGMGNLYLEMKTNEIALKAQSSLVNTQKVANT